MRDTHTPDTSLLCSQAFAKDAKLLQLLNTFITKHASLADTPAATITADQIKQLQEAVKEAEVNTPDAFKLDAAQVGPWPSVFTLRQRCSCAPIEAVSSASAELL
jgi:hypothetical protein